MNDQGNPQAIIGKSADGDRFEERIVSLMQQVGCTLRCRMSQHDSQYFNRVVNQVERPLDIGGVCELTLNDSLWHITIDGCLDEERPESANLSVRFCCMRGELTEGSLAVDLAFTGWSRDNYVLMPSAAYNGNRFSSRRIPYSPKLYYVDDIGSEKPIIITDVPRLNLDDGPSRIQERSGSMAVPSIGFYSPTHEQGFLLLTQQGNSLGDYGLSIEENRDRSEAILSVTSPVVREGYNYRNCDLQSPSLDRPHRFKAGDEVCIEVYLCGFKAESVQALFDRLAQDRKRLVTKQAPRNTLPYSACFAMQEEKFNRENFVPQHGYYSVGPRDNFLQDWQIGWVGGMISTYPLLFAGQEETRKNVLRNFDWLFPNGISPSGFFWDCGRFGTEWLGGDIRKPHTANWHLIRKSGDAVFYIIKQFMLMESLGIEVKPAWCEGLRGVCDAFVSLWRKHGQFGQFVDSLSGDIVVGGSTSAAIVPAALVLASRYYEHETYLEVAQQAGDHFYQKFTTQGLSCGGPGDALQNPDSESSYALIESYVALYEALDQSVWLERAAEVARQFATWVVAYDFAFPPASTFGKTGIRTTGAVYANTQNKHAAPGICTFSGLGLFKLFRATGDRLFLDMLFDIAHNLPQYLPHPSHPLGAAAAGCMCERVNMTDWEGPDRVGETLGMSTWAETSLMLTTIEIPGLYVQVDQPWVVAFDNIEAEILSVTHDELEVRVSNPTALTAQITLLVENAQQRTCPLDENVLLKTQREQLHAEASKILRFKRGKTNV